MAQASSKKKINAPKLRAEMATRLHETAVPDAAKRLAEILISIAQKKFLETEIMKEESVETDSKEAGKDEDR